MKYYTPKLDTAFTYDDIQLVPQRSAVSSRLDVDISVELVKGRLNLPVPIISASMDTITGTDMAITMAKLGAMGIIHRYQSIADRFTSLRTVKEALYKHDGKIKGPVGVSIGLNDTLEQVGSLLEFADLLNVDIAHAHSDRVIEYVESLRSKFSKACLMVGNIATRNAAYDLIKAGADVLKSGIGNGCFAGDTRILMSDGSYKNIKDIKVKDRVINKFGNPVDVVSVRFSGIKKVLKYKNNLWYGDTYVTPDHKHWVGDCSHIKNMDKCIKREVLDKFNSNGESKYKWVSIGDCKGGNFYPLIPKNINFEIKETFYEDLNSYSLSRRNMDGFVTLPTLKPSYELGYLFGTFLGDGYAKIAKSTRTSVKGNKVKNTSGMLNWYFGSNELEIANRVQNFFKVVFDYVPIIKRNDKGNMIVVSVRSNPIIRLFEMFGKKDNKNIPINFICSNKDYCKGLLDGLIDSDGHVGKDGRDGFCNTSSTLMEQYGLLHYIVRGYYPSVVKRTPPKTHSFGNTSNWKDLYHSRSLKRAEFTFTKEYQISSINSMEPVEIEVDTYDIEVNDGSHSFIANNVIVHNSICSTRIQTAHGVPSITSITNIKETIDGLDAPVTVVADGGQRYPGDLVKSFAVGASACMLGSMLSGTDECPGKVIQKSDGMYYKQYRGMAAKETQDNWKGLKEGTVAEGVVAEVPYKGPVSNIVKDLCGAIRSAFSYSGSFNFKEFQTNVEIIRVTQSGIREAYPHILL